MHRPFRIQITWLFCAALIAVAAPPSWAVVVYLPEVEATSGESIDIPIMIDRVDNLAGVKLVIEYDHHLLSFQKGARTSHTDSLMHVINDKNPGRLIVVMAGAKGIKGKAFPLLTLTFHIKRDLKNKVSTQPAITEVQLMTDQLKEIKCDLKTNPVRISPNLKKAISNQEAPPGKQP
ncbi:MAG: cohesin domain-containing protein [Thermodesulfobacteriota bacterium]|nr:cohesin domain-containing protein [Thermodesulfobacteriota bacterium]